MSEKSFVLSLIDTYSMANDLDSLTSLKTALGKYDLTTEEVEELNRLIDGHIRGVLERKGLSNPYGRPSLDSPATRSGEEHGSDNEAKIAELLVTFKTNPDGLAGAIEESLSPQVKARLSDTIRARLEKKGLIESIDWERNVSAYLDRCERQGAIPMYRTRYAGKRFEDREHPGEYLVLFICYGRKWSQWFNNVPLEDIERLEAE